jgi:hypothetical protein
VVTDSVFASPAANIECGVVIVWAGVSAANTVTIRFVSVTGVAINPGTVKFFIPVLQYRQRAKKSVFLNLKSPN